MGPQLFYALYGTFAVIGIACAVGGCWVSPWFFLGLLPTGMLTVVGLQQGWLEMGD